MKRFSIRALSIAAVVGIPLVAPPYAVADNDRVDVEWEELTSEYEDDAWYDVTEWFDGNDYNPVGENVFDDGDNDLGPTNIVGFDEDQYGFDSRSDNDDWFYDYYDDNYLSMTCYRFFGQFNSLFWTARKSPSDALNKARDNKHQRQVEPSSIHKGIQGRGRTDAA